MTHDQDAKECCAMQEGHPAELDDSSSNPPSADSKEGYPLKEEEVVDLLTKMYGLDGRAIVRLRTYRKIARAYIRDPRRVGESLNSIWSRRHQATKVDRWAMRAIKDELVRMSLWDATDDSGPF